MTWNPLYDSWRFFARWGMPRLSAVIADGDLDEYDWYVDRDRRDSIRVAGTTLGRIVAVEGSKARHRACNRWSWAVPAPEAVTAIAALGPIVEIGAGTGYWARLLTDAGADVVAYDHAPPELHPDLDEWERRRDRFIEPKNQWHPHASTWFPIIEGDTGAAADHPDRTLLLCWPPYDSPMGFDAASAYLDAGGRRIVYIGEPPGGCTGDMALHQMLGLNVWCDRCEYPSLYDDDPDGPEHTCGAVARCQVVDEISIPQWDGLHDQVWVAEATLAASTIGATSGTTEMPPPGRNPSSG